MLILLLLWTLTLGPVPNQPTPTPPKEPPPNGVTLPPLAPLPPLPQLPAPTPQPPVPPPGAECWCLKWDFTADPELSHFAFLVSPDGGKETMIEGVPAVESLVTEASCEQLHLFMNGRYAVKVLAVYRDGSKGDPSESVCITVQNRHLYACDAAAKGETCTSS